MKHTWDVQSASFVWDVPSSRSLDDERASNVSGELRDFGTEAALGPTGITFSACNASGTYVIVAG